VGHHGDEPAAEGATATALAASTALCTASDDPYWPWIISTSGAVARLRGHAADRRRDPPVRTQLALIFAEPLIQQAIDYESGRSEVEAALATAAGSPVPAEGPEIFSRAIQGNLGIGVGMIFFGLAVGCFFGVAYCLLYGRTGGTRPRQLSLRVALGGFLALYLVPSVKYPANPPAIGNPDTISQRAGLYGVMVVASVVFGLGRSGSAGACRPGSVPGTRHCWPDSRSSSSSAW
jgi:hypothetical protein